MLTQILLTRVELSMKECKENLFNQHVCEYTTKEEIYVCMTAKIAYGQVQCLKGTPPPKKGGGAIKVNSTPAGNLTLAISAITV
jgi:hypothetical protein